MALDKLVDSAQLDTDLTAVADAIRTKGGTNAPLAFPQGFVDAVGAIESGGGDVQHASGTFIGTGNEVLSIPLGFVPDVLFIKQNDDTSLKKRIEMVFTVSGVGASGLYYSNDTGTTPLKAVLAPYPDPATNNGNIYISKLSSTGANVRISTSQCAAGVEYAYDAWKFM